MRHRSARLFTLLPLASAVLVATTTLAAEDERLIADVQGIIRVAGRPAHDVAIWLHLDGDKPAPVRARALLDQRTMQFTPRVLAIPVGTTVEMPNSDAVFHNVFSFHNGKVFDLGTYPAGNSRTVTFDRPGLSRVFCNIHPNMAAYVLAVESTLVAVSGSAGRFAMQQVPAGTHTFSVWRPGKPVISGTLIAEVGRVIEVDIR